MRSMIASDISLRHAAFECSFGFVKFKNGSGRCCRCCCRRRCCGGGCCRSRRCCFFLKIFIIYRNNSSEPWGRETQTPYATCLLWTRNILLPRRITFTKESSFLERWKSPLEYFRIQKGTSKPRSSSKSGNFTPLSIENPFCVSPRWIPVSPKESPRVW